MSDEQEDVSLANLAMGGAVERFDDELKVVLRNILDPNTTLSARSITLTVKFKPDQNRDFSVASIDVKSKLAPSTPLQTKMFIADTKDGAVATEYSPKEPYLPGTGLPGTNATTGNVTPLRTISGGN